MEYTKTMRNSSYTTARKRSLKPLVEKKRRERMNQSLDELRTLLMKHNPDTRLKNPKLEKAEILELTVEYLRRRTNKGSAVQAPESPTGAQPKAAIAVHPSEPSLELPGHSYNSLYSAGYRQCASHLASFFHCINPPKRDCIVQGLRHYLEPCTSCLLEEGQSQPSPVDPLLWFHLMEAQLHLSPVSPSRPDSVSPRCAPLYPKHPLGQSIAHAFPSPPYSLSPPPSPCDISSSSPPYLPFPNHFTFPHTTSPLSADSSFSTSPHPVPALSNLGPAVNLNTLPLPASSHLTPLSRPFPLVHSSTRRGQRGNQKQLFPSQTGSTWRPWS